MRLCEAGRGGGLAPLFPAGAWGDLVQASPSTGNQDSWVLAGHPQLHPRVCRSSCYCGSLTICRVQS